MQYEEAYKRLWNHANLPRGIDEDASVGYALWQVARGKEPRQPLRDLCDDVITCLDCVNLHLNGAVPSATPVSKKQHSIDRGLAYSIASIVDIAIDALRRVEDLGNPTERDLLNLVWCVCTAWSAILAGDIDCLEDHLTVERQTRGID